MARTKCATIPGASTTSLGLRSSTAPPVLGRDIPHSTSQQDTCKPAKTDPVQSSVDLHAIHSETGKTHARAMDYDAGSSASGSYGDSSSDEDISSKDGGVVALDNMLCRADEETPPTRDRAGTVPRDSKAVKDCALASPDDAALTFLTSSTVTQMTPIGPCVWIMIQKDVKDMTSLLPVTTQENQSICI